MSLQGKQVSARAEHTVERLGVVLQRLRILPQHLADPDDRIEWRAQLAKGRFWGLAAACTVRRSHTGGSGASKVSRCCPNLGETVLI
jgi:hypothetical protein